MTLYIANWATEDDAAAQNDDHDFTAYDLAHPAGVIFEDGPDMVKRVLAHARKDILDVLAGEDDMILAPIKKYRWRKDKDTRGVWYLGPGAYAVLIIQEAVRFK